MVMEREHPYILGLDLGIASIGWSVIGIDPSGHPRTLLRTGVHLFESGTEGDVQSGRDQSRAGPRRMARGMRRQYWRRARRKRKLLRLLQGLGLMPSGEVSTPEGVDALLKSLDAELRAKWEAGADHRARQLLPYVLRARGIEGRLEPYEVGRALYHLAQRRGFLSNRRDAGGDDEDAGAVRAGIIELERLMGASGGSPTLGAFFASLDPTDPEQRRIRGRWTARDMYAAEFERLWAEQARHHPSMTAEAKRAVHNAIFFQRPLKSAAHLVGECELERGEKRAKVGLRIAQRFRMLQRLNDLEIILPDLSRRPLSDEERAKVLTALQREGDISFTKLRQKQYLGLPKGSTFNLESTGDKLPGHRTDAKLRAVFGDRFDQLSEDERDAVVMDLISFEKPSALARRGKAVWGLDDEQAAALGELLLEQGYAAHSVRALQRLVEAMEDGTQYATARKRLYPGSMIATTAHDLLPPVDVFKKDVRNPGVTRSLSEMRKVVNAIIRRYGKPELIRVELSRDLKRSRKMRERMSRENREQERRRDRAKEELLRKTALRQPRRSDVERLLLAEECGWICPYTGRPFGMEDLFGHHPRLDVEHIWPLPRSLDDSFLNKTLCWHEENRSRKRNRTPFEAYAHGDPEAWAQMLDRVRRFTGDAARIKLERFKAEAIPEGFAERHLAETRHTSALAAEYLGTLYGGRVDAEHRQRVFVTTGGLTAHLRREWALDGVLSFKDEKDRADHRHHAIDAVVIALTDPGAVAALQRAAERASETGRRLFAPVELPWKGFVEDVRASVEAINVSHRQSRRVSGKLHAETLYSRAIRGQNGAAERRVRKELHKLTVGDVERIADPAVREVVKARLAELGQEPAKAFIDPTNHPRMRTKAGGWVPIHKVRVVVKDKPWRVGSGPRERHVTATPGSNHHLAIWERQTSRGPVWEEEAVGLLECYHRRGRGEPIVNRADKDGRRLVFTLAPGEFIEMDVAEGSGQRSLYRVTNISDGQSEVRLHSDGRPVTLLRADKKSGRKDERVRIPASKLQRLNARKVAVTYLGEIRNAGG